MDRQVIGIDLGGTFIKGALFDEGGNILEKFRLPTGVSEGKQHVLDNILEVINRLSSPAAPVAVGIGVPGIITPGTGVIVKSPNFPGWEHFPMKERLQSSLSIPLFIDNDANCAAMGERWLGAGRDYDSFILLTLGTGIGGGLVINNELYRGNSGRGGELGHITLEIDGRKCSCGGVGCMEAYASGWAIVDIAKQGARANRESVIWKDYLAKGDPVTPRDVYRAALAGDTLSKEVYSRAGSFLGAGIASIVNTLDLPVCIIGGGVAEGYELLEPSLRKGIEHHIFGIDPGEVKVMQAGAGNDAGAIGAAYIALMK